MERIGLGEEVTVQYVKSTLVMCCEMWNTVVDSMKLSLRDRALEMIREQDAELAALNPQELDQKLNEFMTRTQRLLAPIRVSENDATLVPLDMFSQSFVKFCPKVLTVTLLKLTTHKLTYIHRYIQCMLLQGRQHGIAQHSQEACTKTMYHLWNQKSCV